MPVFGVGNPNNSYGFGFYCIREIALAKEWGCVEDSGDFANQYELDLSELSVMAFSVENHRPNNCFPRANPFETFKKQTISSVVAQH